LFDILDIAFLIGIDVHLLLLETNSAVTVAQHGQHSTSFALNIRYTESMCKTIVPVVACQWSVPRAVF